MLITINRCSQRYGPVNCVSKVPKGTDTFQSFIIKKTGKLTKVFFISLSTVSIMCHFFNNFGETVNLNLMT